MSKTKQHFLEMQEHLQDKMDDDDYQHQQYKESVFKDTNQLTNLFKSFGEAIRFAKELNQSNENRHF
jgi:transcription initiation factor TFIID subunit TAF12